MWIRVEYVEYIARVCISKSNCNTPVQFWPFLFPVVRRNDRCGPHVYMRIYWHTRSLSLSLSLSFSYMLVPAKYNSHTPNPLCVARENDQREKNEISRIALHSPRWLLWYMNSTGKKCLLSLRIALAYFSDMAGRTDLCIYDCEERKRKMFPK